MLKILYIIDHYIMPYQPYIQLGSTYNSIVNVNLKIPLQAGKKLLSEISILHR